MRAIGGVLFLSLAGLVLGGKIASAETVQMTLSSPVLKEGEAIPAKYTCDGDNFSPPLTWQGAPRDTQSFVLIMEDPDTSKGVWTHWVLFNIPPTIHNLPGEMPAIRTLANAERHGLNDFKNLGYGGPCPPSGSHRYYFKLYALDYSPNLEPGATKEQISAAIQGHILAEAELMRPYQRKKSA